MPALTSDKLVDLYLRLSNKSEEADSLERQERDGRAWAASEGLEVRKVWRDDGKSGFKTGVKRAGFDEALKAIVSGEAKTLFVWKLDRLSRQGAGQVGVFLDDVERVGGRLIFLKDGLDTRMGNAARIPIMVLSEIARAESVNTSIRVKDRKAADRAAGKYLGSGAPLGYCVNEYRRLVPHPTEFPLMRELVSRVAAGETLLTVARDWNARGVPTRRGGLWRPSTLSRSLRSPTLAGLMTFMDERREIHAYRHPATGEHVSVMAEGHDPIASQGEQARLIAIMDGRLRAYGRGLRPVRQPKTLLGRMAVCSGCGKRLTSFGDSYRCKRTFADGTCPAPVNVSVAVLDAAVRRAWATHLAALEPGDPVLSKIADAWLQKFDPAPLRERAELAAEIEEVDERLRKVDTDHYDRGVLDEERHARIAAGLSSRLSALRDRLAALPRPEADLGALLDPELSLPLIENASPQEARDLLALAIEAVVVSPAPRRGARFSPADRLTYRWIAG